MSNGHPQGWPLLFLAIIAPTPLSSSISYVDNTLNSLVIMACRDAAKGVWYVDATTSPVPAPADLRQSSQPRPRGRFPGTLAHPVRQPENAADDPGCARLFLSAPAPGSAAPPLAGCDAPDPGRCRCLASSGAAQRLGTLHAPHHARSRAALLHLSPGAGAAGPPPDSPPSPGGAAPPDAPQA